MNQFLINKLKEGRAKKSLKQSQVADLIGIKPNTLSGWENGVTEPDIDTFLELCRIYDLDYASILEEAYDYKSPNIDFYLNEKEVAHIEDYRQLDSFGKDVISTILKKELERVRAQTQRRYETQKEQPQHFKVIEPPKMIPSYQGITGASAGTGQYVFDDLVPNMIEVYGNSKADFVIDVRGNSMVPTYNDGDGLLVIKQDAVDTGEIGIFMVDNEAYVKECGGDRLISHNKKYPDILLKDHQDIRCIGKVIGKLD